MINSIYFKLGGAILALFFIVNGYLYLKSLKAENESLRALNGICNQTLHNQNVQIDKLKLNRENLAKGLQELEKKKYKLEQVKKPSKPLKVEENEEINYINSLFNSF